MRSQGVLAYDDALGRDRRALTRRLNGILADWQGESAVVRFDPRALAEDLA